jgi:hypothetical protein
MSINELLSLLSGVPGGLSTVWTALKVGSYAFKPSFYFFEYMCLFFFLYVGSIQLYQLHLLKKLPMWGYILGGQFVALMMVVDVSFQYTVFALLYREWPPKKEYTVTQRLQRWCDSGQDTLRMRWSLKLCAFLNLFTAPGSPHCGKGVKSA